MPEPQISIIAAIGENCELGKNNKLLWNIPEDLKRFKKLTLGHPVIMGRKTFESIGQPLHGRINIIITRDKNYKQENCLVTYSLEKAIRLAKSKENNEIFIIGGGQIYNQAINLADKLYLTIISGTFDADTYFPDYSRFHKVISQIKGQDEFYKYSFLELIV